MNRLHTQLTALVPAGTGHRRLTVKIAAGLLLRTRPKDPERQAARRVSVKLLAELRRLERRISPADTNIASAVDVTGSTLLHGVDVARAVFASLRATRIADLLGLPAVAVPVGLVDGFPQAVQVIGPGFEERSCLEAAAVIEAAAGPRRPIDPCSQTAADRRIGRAYR